MLPIFHLEASFRRRTHRSSWGSRQGNIRRQQHHNLMEGCMTCRKSREQRALSARNASLPVEHCCIPLVEACFRSSWRGLPNNTDPLRSRLTRYMSCDSSHERQLRMSRSENWLRAASPANSNWGHLAQVLELVHLAQVLELVHLAQVLEQVHSAQVLVQEEMDSYPNRLAPSSCRLPTT